ncbi:MAG: NUDIX domain-containing protein [bacterium]
MTVEYVNTYDINNPYQIIPMKRDEFYDEQIEIYKKTGAPTKAVDIIDVILFNEAGEFIIQKRADHKRHNPNLLDKTIGGHVQNGDNPNHTVMVETVQELEIPSLVVNTHTEFMRTYYILSEYLQSIGLIQHIDTKIYNMEKIFDKEKVVIANRVHFYL